MDNVDEEDLDKVNEYLASMQKEHTLIIDHVTLFNRSVVRKIENKALGIVSKVLLIQTGFSASATRHDEEDDEEYHFDNKWQLNSKEFKTIWIECLKKIKYSLENQETFVNDLYDYCKNNFIITPRLLRRVQCYVVHQETDYECGNDVGYFMHRYIKSLVSDVTKFRLEYNKAVYSESMTNEKQLCGFFSLHTKLLLHQLSLSENQDMILTLKQENLFKIAINIFHSEYRHVTDNDLEKDVRYSELGLEKGDRYIRITHLMPQLSDHWQEVFPFNIYEIIDNKFGLDAGTILKICFELDGNGIRKEVERELVNLQYQMKFLIHPMHVKETHCKILQGASTKFTLHQCNGMKVTKLTSLNYYQPSITDVAEHENTAVRMGYKGHDKNVAKMACYINEKIDRKSNTSLFVYPAISNFKGIDYIIYTENHSLGQSNETPKRKKKNKKELYALYLVQVATGATHTGDTIGQALTTFTNIIKDVPIHVVIFIARKEEDDYTLNGHMLFENASVINLVHLSLKGWLEKNKLLYQIIKMIQESPMDKK